ncbi:Flp pilus assembly pilin Flp [Hoeflea halophila]|uniref:Flp pilus assembly pilin Flp n=2 Tax=Hoeflea halophila TaxID=714899 RepID=A0A286ID41_9HYPH|nr:Flp pilus assembly pilin Flp [Hoeflea halophila]
MKVLCTRAVNCDSGAAAIEYALTAAIFAVLLFTGVETLGKAFDTTFTSMSQKLDSAAPDRSNTAGGTSLVALDTASPARAIGSVDGDADGHQP